MPPFSLPALRSGLWATNDWIVEIDDSMIGDDKEMLEDLIAAAVNDAVHKVEKANQAAMQEMTAGLNLPPGFKLPF